MQKFSQRPTINYERRWCSEDRICPERFYVDMVLSKAGTWMKFNEDYEIKLLKALVYELNDLNPLVNLKKLIYIPNESCFYGTGFETTYQFLIKC